MNNLWEDRDILKRFCNDYSLPISVYEPKLMEYYISLYDDILQTKSKYELLKTTLADFDYNKDAFLSYGNQLAERVIIKIKETDAFNNFMNCDMDEYMPVHNEIEGIKYVKSVNLYNPDNDGKYFVSIDMRKANFQALQYFDTNIVFNTYYYDDFISMFTDKTYFKQSKDIRQVIFGKLTNGRLQRQERHMMERALNALIHFGHSANVSPSVVRVFTTDEIILEGKPEESPYTDLAYTVFINTGIRVRLELFKLRYLGHGAYVKEHENGEPPTFKCCSSIYFPQIYKTYMNKPIQDEDLYFMYEKKLAKFVESLEWEIKK